MAWSPLPRVEESDSLPRCAWHYGYTAITASGSVAACCAVPRQEDDFGRVVPGRSTFGDVWNNELYATSRAAFADTPIEATRETVCTRCPVPRFVHHMYSLHDFKVIGQFDRTFGGSESLLKGAFDLLSQTCYGLSIENLFPGGTFRPPSPLFGKEHQNRQARAAFVEFFERNLITEGMSVQPSPGDAVSTMVRLAGG